MYCKNCGKEIDDGAYVCVHCGVLIKENNEYQTKKTNGMAIAGFVCSFFIPLLGWIFGGIGLSKAKKSLEGKGRGFSIAALWISSVTVIVNLIIYFS